MKLSTLLTLSALVAVHISSNAFAEEKSLGKFTLKPGEKHTVTVTSNATTKIGFSNDLQVKQMMDCKNGCIKMTVPGSDIEFSSAAGGALPVPSKNGKVEVVFENVEAFDIPISTFQK